MVFKCCITDCASDSYKTKIPFFCFPNDSNVRMAWINATGITPENRTSKRRVCCRHFNDDDYFKFSTKHRLKPGIIPHLNLRRQVQPFTQMAATADQRSCSVRLAPPPFKLTVQKRKENIEQRSRKMSETGATFSCAQCSHQTASQFQLDHHFQRKHIDAAEAFPDEPQLYFCVDDIAPASATIESSGQFHETPATFSCNHCKYNGHSILLFVKHNHGSCEAPKETAPMEPEFVFVDVTEISGELDKEWSCSKCSHRVESEANLKKHMLAYHANDKDVKRFNCSQCSYRSNFKNCLKLHMLSHAKGDDVEWFECTICDYKTKYKNSSLKRHMLTHAADDEVDWYGCDACPYKTKQKRHLKRHVLTHAPAAKVNWFLCTKCSFQAKSKQNLNNHVCRYAAPQ